VAEANGVQLTKRVSDIHRQARRGSGWKRRAGRENVGQGRPRDGPNDEPRMARIDHELGRP
jgi:hypothetical protein